MQKRPSGPFPIFGKVGQQGRGNGGATAAGRGGAKRPRIALYSHPNNIIGEDTETRGPFLLSPWGNSGRGTTSSATSGATPQTWDWKQAAEKKWPQQERGRGGYGNVSDKGPNKENVPPAPHYGTQKKITANYYTPPPFPPPPPQHLQQHHSQQYNTLTTQHHIGGGERGGHGSIEQLSKKTADTSVKGGGGGGQGGVSKKGVSRVVTTTGQGIQQWILLTGAHEHITFELFGIVISPLSLGEYDSRQFLLKTSSGTVKCCYWEMGVRFPPISKGKSYRAVGNWDSRHQFLKTVSLRLTEPEEQQFLPQMLAATNRLIREIAAVTREQ